MVLLQAEVNAIETTFITANMKWNVTSSILMDQKS